MQRRIFWSMLAVMAVALFIALAGTSVLRQRAIDDREQELTRQAAVAADLIDEQLSRPAVEGVAGRVRIRVLLEQLRRLGGHDFLEAGIVTASGSVDPVVAEAPLLSAATAEADRLVAGDVTSATFQTEVNGVPIIATLRLVDLGDRRATVLIAIGRGEPLLESSTFGPRAWVAFAIGAILAAILAGILASRLGRRLDAVGGAASRLAAGDFAVRAEVEGDDGVSRLAEAFNDMAAQLGAARTREHEFLLSVGHDLRTPLTTIRGYAEGLHSGVITTDDLPRVAEVLDAQTTRLSRLIEDLMLLARLEAHEFSIRPERVDLAAITRGLVAADRGRAEQLGITITANIDDVGDVLVDPDRYGQTFGNLIDNALRYTPEGSEIVVTLAAVDGRAELGVADSGPGIEQADLDRVFERLYVARRYQPLRPEGSGLGLSIVKELVTAAGGTVAVESSIGVGTTVIVTLPLAPSAS